MAIQDVVAGTGKISKAEILCITDCEDQFSVADILRVKGDYEFNVLDVAGSASQSSVYGAAQLRQCANKYYKASETELNPEKIVSLV